MTPGSSGASGNGEPGLEGGTLWAKVAARTSRALASGALRPIPTTFEYVEQDGIRFMVRTLSTLVRKDEERWRKEREAGVGREVNPFLPYEEELFVSGLSDTHLCLLNKFNVVSRHLLVVTSTFEEQDTYLTREDFAAMLTCLAEYDGLAFYNGGVVAGASQRHKHLQFVPLPLAPLGPKVPVEPAVAEARFEGAIGRSRRLPFVHALGRIDPGWTGVPVESAAKVRDLFHLMLHAVGMERGDVPRRERQSGPYNLLVTREWMLLVPRSREFFRGTSVNALGFAGALLVRNEEEMAVLRDEGPMTALRSVACSL